MGPKLSVPGSVWALSWDPPEEAPRLGSQRTRRAVNTSWSQRGQEDMEQRQGSGSRESMSAILSPRLTAPVGCSPVRSHSRLLAQHPSPPGALKPSPYVVRYGFSSMNDAT